jgi:protein-S-isoprenylcysteine O-methyltransferase Ste14
VFTLSFGRNVGAVGSLFQGFAIKDRDACAPRGNETIVLQRIQRNSHTGTLGAEHQAVNMQKVSAVLGSVLFFVVAPCVLAGLIPWWMTRWEVGRAFLGLEVTRAVGVLLILVGLPGLVDSFARFALQGLGTPAPVAPTKNLVVTGLYRYVRNPIYVAVVAIILGQAILFGDWRLVLLGALFWLAFHLFVVAYEEPTLQGTFGAEYEAYRANVQHWIPRVTPWRAPEAGSR